MRVLVIDDECAIRRVIKRFLAPEHDVVTAEDASEALLQLAGDEPFDVILCDVNLPGMTGHQFLAQLSPLDASRTVLMTGECCDSAGWTMLAKPFSRDGLEAALEATIPREVA